MYVDLLGRVPKTWGMFTWTGRTGQMSQLTHGGHKVAVPPFRFTDTLQDLHCNRILPHVGFRPIPLYSVSF